MGRQLFLHHYLPAHLASSLVAGALIEFIFTMEPVENVVAAAGKNVKKTLPTRERLGGQNLFPAWAATAVVAAIVLFGWYFFLPLTYGYPGLSVPEVESRKWLDYDLHFAK